MRVVFMGTPEFAVPILTALRTDHDVVAVYSRPDRPSGRGRKLVVTPVKAAALAAGLPVRQPERLRDEGETELLAALVPDVIVVAAFGAILPRPVLDIPRFGCVNVHASLLPRWRGAAPIQRAILAGDVETGVSIMRMEEGLDTGPWCAQQSVGVADKDADELGRELAGMGACLLSQVLPHLSDGSLLWHAQDDVQATYASKVTADDVSVGPYLTVCEFLARVRASGPSAPCRLRLGDRNLTIIAAEVSPTKDPAELVTPGRARCAGHLDLGCADGSVRLARVVPEGRGEMAGDAFVRGARLDTDCEWGPR